MEYTCERCGKKYLYKRHTSCTTKLCKACYSKRRRDKLKQKAVDKLGGKCIVCGYNKTNDCLSFHHLDPKIKEYNIARNLNRSWEAIEKELDKCVLLCLNCHGEVHAGIIVL